MENDDHHLIIGIDWKFVGRDYLAFFPDRYGELDFLRSEVFEQICDELANELPENCFPVLSSFLGGYGYELWNINTGGDDYALLIAPAGQGENVCREMISGFDEFLEGGYRFERVAPDALPFIGQPASKLPKKKKPPSMEAESDWHRSYGGVWRAGVKYDVVEFDDENDEGSTAMSLVDLHSFPLNSPDADGFHALIDAKHSFFALHAVAGGQYWQWEKPQKRHKVWGDHIQSLAFIGDYAKPEIAEVEHSMRRAWLTLGTYGIDNRLFQTVRIEGGEPWLDVSVPDLRCLLPAREPSKPIALLEIEGVRCRHIATVGEQTGILPIKETEIALFEEPERTESADPGGLLYALFDVTTGAVGTTGILPPDADLNTDRMFVLSADEIACVRRKTHPHPTCASLKEAVGWLNRFNLRTGAWREAKLDGLFDDYQVNMSVLRNQAPDKHRVRSFEGAIEACKGHDDWWVFNYLTSSSGKHDIAWLWNSATDEILKIEGQDFPRREPYIHFNAELGRYIADESCRLTLLTPFEEFRVGRETSKLRWLAGG
jgi:hypothetical protein